MPSTLSNLEDEKSPSSPKVANPFATVNRISVGLLLVGCVGFAIAIAGYITDSFWLAVVGSCIVLAMTLGWIAASSYGLAATILIAVSARLSRRNSRYGSERNLR